MTQRTDKKPAGMKGGVRRPRGPNGKWSFVIDMGLQDAQRCVDCGHRVWVGPKRQEMCPKCGGTLRDTRERRQAEEGGYPTEKVAKEERAKALVKLGKGRYLPPERMSLAEFLRDTWLPDVRSSGLGENTKEGYERTVRHYLIGPAKKPHSIGLVELRKLSVNVIRTHYRELMEKGYVAEDYGRTAGGRRIRDKKTGQWKRELVDRPPISYSTVKHVQAALHAALAEAVEMGMLDINPATGAIRKKKLGEDVPASRKVKAWSPDQLKAFLTATAQTEDYPMWRVIALHGLRRSEALGLKESDLRPDVPSIRISRVRVPLGGGRVAEKPRTKNGEVREVLTDRETMEELQAMLRRRRGKVRILHSDDYLFVDDQGQPMKPNSVTYRFRKAVTAAKLPQIGVHGLRHSHVSQLLADGVDVLTVADRVGHKSPKMTLDVYGHSRLEQQEGAVASMARYSRTTAR